jgi:photosystem II stability/assembly factor-like uncharacterized protein
MGKKQARERATRVLGCCILLLGCSAVTQAADIWTPAAGPTGGAVVEMASTDLAMFVATWGGGVWRSFDEGDTWSPVGSTLPAGTEVLDVAAVGNHVFAALHDGGVYRSDDDGDTWVDVSAGLPGEANQLIADGDDLLALSGLGVLSGDLHRTSDLGATWTILPASTPISLLGKDDSVIYGDSSFAIGLFRSFDGGLNWEDCPSDGLFSGAVNELAARGNRLFAGHQSSLQGKLAYTDDHGSTWTTVTLPGDELQVLDVVGEALFVGLGQYSEIGPLYRSLNDGDTWAPVDVGFAGGEGQQINFVEMHAGRLYAGTEKGLYRSDSMGDLWTPVNVGLNATRTQCIVVDDWGLHTTVGQEPLHERAIPALNPERKALDAVYSSFDGGMSWVEGSTGLPADCDPTCLVAKDALLFVGTVHEGVYRSADGGMTWSEARTGLPEPIGSYGEIEFLAVNGGSLFAGTRPRTNGGGHGSRRTQGGGVFRSDNNGTSWVSANNGIPLLGEHDPPFSYQHYPYIEGLNAIDGVLFLGTEEQGVFRSVNNGASWTPVNSGLPSHPQYSTYPRITSFVAHGDSILASSSGYYLAGSYERAAGIYRSLDGGSSWARIAPGAQFGARAVMQVVSECSTLYAVVGAGQGWLYMSYDPADGVYKSKDGGYTWAKATEGIEHLIITQLYGWDDELYVSTYGQGVWSIPLDGDLNENGTYDICEPLGDIDGNEIVDLTDYISFTECMAGPGVLPAPDAPLTWQDCVVYFDHDGDDDVDLLDYIPVQGLITRAE